MRTQFIFEMNLFRANHSNVDVSDESAAADPEFESQREKKNVSQQIDGKNVFEAEKLQFSVLFSFSVVKFWLKNI